MADYAQLLARAIASLPENTSDARRAIFARAREALERQVRSISPPLGEAEVLAVQIQLEDAIRHVEAEQGHLTTLAGAAAAPSQPAKAEAGAEARTGSPAHPDSPGASVGNARSLPEPGQRNTDAPTEVADRIAAGSPIRSRPRVPVGSNAINPQGGVSPGPAFGPATTETQRPVVEPRRSGTDGRIRMPVGDKKPPPSRAVVFFAIGGFVALAAMGLLALSSREGPGRYLEASQPPRTPEAADPTKREGRLSAGEASPDANESNRSDQKQASVPVPAGSPPSSIQTEPAPVHSIPVASRAYMVLEASGGGPSQFSGVASWSFSGGRGNAPDARSILAQVEIAAAGMGIEISISRNSDVALKASHTILIVFEPRGEIGNVREMSAMEWREREGQAGATFSGTLVPISDNVFMIGLDEGDFAQNRNLDLLKSQKWLVFEIKLASGRLGALLIEKGSGGEKAIGEALAAWK